MINFTLIFRMGLTLAILAGLFNTRPARSQGPARPNIIFILADDLDYDTIHDNVGKSIDGTVFMPNLKNLLMDRGVTFDHAYVNFSVCCPSRATILRGQYAHNTEVLGNAFPLGGFRKFYERGKEQSTIATWLQTAGYRTALIGKYLNGYPNTAPPTHVPPGWSEWYAHNSEPSYYNYTWIENGTAVVHGNQAADYLTDTISAKATDFIGRTTAPFFLYLSPYAPHALPVPAPRHLTLFPNLRARRDPSFNEPDVSDKPTWYRTRPLLNTVQINAIDGLYRNRMRSMMAMDDMIGALVQKLTDTGKLGNTYIFFTSDNGYHQGTHRLFPEKSTAFEEDIRVPLFVSGPGVPQGVRRPHITVNTDFAPTWAELAGVIAPDWVDGRSLKPLLTGSPPSLENWRSAFLVEHYQGADSIPLTYDAIRTITPTSNTLYVEYAGPGTGNENREFYLLNSDPFQISNSYEATDPAVTRRLADQLHQLKACAGGGCRAVENGASTAQARVVNGASFMPGFSQNTWLTIFGDSLSSTTRAWDTPDFVNGRLPTQLDGVRVTVNGNPAYLSYVSPTQINVLSPILESSDGNIQVEVTRNGVRSAMISTQMQKFAPALFTFPAEGNKYVAATHADGAYLGKTTLYPGRSTPARAGEVISLYGTGLGPTDPAIPRGEVVRQPARLTTPLTVSFGGIAGEVSFAGLSATGLYQINVRIPGSVPNGDVPVIVEVEGFRSPAALLTVER